MDSPPSKNIASSSNNGRRTRSSPRRTSRDPLGREEGSLTTDNVSLLSSLAAARVRGYLNSTVLPNESSGSVSDHHASGSPSAEPAPVHSPPGAYDLAFLRRILEEAIAISGTHVDDEEEEEEEPPSDDSADPS